MSRSPRAARGAPGVELGPASVREGWLLKKSYKTGAWAKRYVWLTADAISWGKTERIQPSKRTIVPLGEVFVDTELLRPKKTIVFTFTQSTTSADDGKGEVRDYYFALEQAEEVSLRSSHSELA